MNARNERIAIKPCEMSDARAEIHESIKEMEGAVFAIIDAAEHIYADLKTRGVPDEASIRSHCTRIMEACSFQDIVGQRLIKISKIISHPEGKDSPEDIADKLLSAEPQGSPNAPDCAPLDGPALAGEGLSQEDVERIWNGPFSAGPPEPRPPKARKGTKR